jgi:hypothetical protein
MGYCGAAADELETGTPTRETFAGRCASALAPTNVSARTIATSPTHFRFSILDFRLSEKDSNHRAQDLLFILLSSIENRKSKI